MNSTTESVIHALENVISHGNQMLLTLACVMGVFLVLIAIDAGCRKK